MTTWVLTPIPAALEVRELLAGLLERRVIALPGDERGLVEEQHERRAGKTLLDEIFGRDGPRARRFTTPSEGLLYG